MRMFSRLSRCLVLMVGLAAWSGSVYAACASPVGNAGEVGYASNLNTLVFCNGTDWVSMAGWNNSSGGDATFLNDLSDVDTSGATTGNVLAYNGTAWVVSDSVVITTLGGLSDVNTAGATTGKILAYNGTAWVVSDSGVITTLSGLSDVNTTGATTGKILAYNGTAWVVSDSGVITTLSGLSDVNTAGATTGKILAYNGTSWVVSDTASGADNLGNHIATMGLNMGGYSISNTNLLSTTPGGIVSGTYGHFQYLSATTIYNPGSLSGNWILANIISSTLVSATNISATLIQTGASTASCDGDLIGAIRYNSAGSTLQICNGVGWTSLSSNTVGVATAASSTGAIQFNVANALAGDTDNLFWNNSTKRLGVGTSAPTQPIEVSVTANGIRGISIRNNTNDTNASGQLIFYMGTGGGAGSVGATGSNYTAIPLLTSRTFIDSGARMDGVAINTENTSPIVFGVANVERMRLMASGLGINTQSPTATLQVSGSFIVSTSAQNTAPSLYVGTNGRVGIGTSAPASKLQIGASNYANNASGLIVAEISDSTIGTGAGDYVYPAEVNYTATTNRARLQTSGYRRVAGSGWQGIGFRLQFGVDNSFTDGSKAYVEIGSDVSGGGLIALGTGGNDRVYINTTGNVGIGTSSAGSSLTIVGEAQVGSSGAACVTATNAGAIRYTGGNLQYCNAANTWSTLGAAGVATAASSTGAIQFNANNLLGGDTANLFWDDTNNRLGIGTSTPGAAVDISASDALRLIKQGGSANSPVLSWFRDGTRQGYMGWGVPGTNFQLAIENNNRFDVIASNTYVSGNVGIGAAPPTAKLDVAGHVGLSGATSNTITFGATGAAVPGNGSAGLKLQLWGNTRNVMATTDYALGVESGALWFNTNDSFKWYTGATQRMVMANNGNVGLGTTSTGNRLSVMRGAGASVDPAILAGDGTQWLLINPNTAAGAYNSMVQAGDTSLLYSTGTIENGGFTIGQWSASAKGIRIDSSGNVGIGTGTPSSKLDVIGVASATTFNASHNDSAAAPGYSWSFDNDTGMFRTGANALAFTTGGSERVRVTAAGNVGIGTGAPGTKLEVVGNVSTSMEVAASAGGSPGQFRAVGGNYGFFIRNDGSDSYFMLTNSGSPYGSWNGLRPISIGNADGLVSIGNNLRLSNGTANSISFGTTGVAAPGNGSAGMKLQLYGGTANVMSAGDYALGIESGTMWFNTGGAYKWYSSSTQRMSLDASGNLTATAYLYSSDKRLKKNITTLTGGLAKLDTLTPVSFSYISDTTDRKRIGVIAQEVEKVYPEAVVTDDKGMKTVDYPALIAPLISAVKQLKADSDVREKTAFDRAEEMKELRANNENLRQTVSSYRILQQSQMAEHGRMMEELIEMRAANDNLTKRLEILEKRKASGQ